MEGEKERKEEERRGLKRPVRRKDTPYVNHR